MIGSSVYPSMAAAQSVTLENFDSSAGKLQPFALRVPDHDGKPSKGASSLLTISRAWLSINCPWRMAV
jgi:hypothetical protein